MNELATAVPFSMRDAEEEGKREKDKGNRDRGNGMSIIHRIPVVVVL